MHEVTYHIFCAFRLPGAAFPGNKYNLVLSGLLELSVGMVGNPEKMRWLVGTYSKVFVVIVMLRRETNNYLL